MTDLTPVSVPLATQSPSTGFDDDSTASILESISTFSTFSTMSPNQITTESVALETLPLFDILMSKMTDETSSGPDTTTNTVDVTETSTEEVERRTLVSGVGDDVTLSSTTQIAEKSETPPTTATEWPVYLVAGDHFHPTSVQKKNSVYKSGE